VKRLPMSGDSDREPCEDTTKVSASATRKKPI